MRSKRKNFSERQKAEIFVLDRALCSFTGKSLWLLDYGAAPSYVDWVDHIDAAARGGTSELDNGACTSWLYNSLKRDRNHDTYLFRRGKPTEHFYVYNEVLSDEIALHLRRFAALHWSDWYFNRAAFHVLVAADQNRRRRMDGRSFTRGREYWAGAAMRFLEAWVRGAQGIPSMAHRGLVPRGLSDDQRALLDLTHASSVSTIKQTIADLAPYVRASWRASAKTADINDPEEAREFLRKLRSDPFVVPRIKKAARRNVQMLFLHKGDTCPPLFGADSPEG